MHSAFLYKGKKFCIKKSMSGQWCISYFRYFRKRCLRVLCRLQKRQWANVNWNEYSYENNSVIWIILHNSYLVTAIKQTMFGGARGLVSVSLQWCHMGVMASQITDNPTICSSVCSGKHQRKQQSVALLAFWEENPQAIDSLKAPVMRKMFLRHSVIMFISQHCRLAKPWRLIKRRPPSWSCRGTHVISNSRSPGKQRWVSVFCWTDLITNRSMHLSHNAPFRTEMYTFLFWMAHCGIWNRCIVGFVKSFNWFSINLRKYLHFLSFLRPADGHWYFKSSSVEDKLFIRYN